jgi:hypothetical protein
VANSERLVANPELSRYGRLQEAADVCGGRGRLWVLNAFLVRAGGQWVATYGGDGQVQGWFPQLMSIATSGCSVVLERFRHGGLE